MPPESQSKSNIKRKLEDDIVGQDAKRPALSRAVTDSGRLAVQKLYEAYTSLERASLLGVQPDQDDFQTILNAVNGSANEKRLAVRILPRYVSYFPESLEATTEAIVGLGTLSLDEPSSCQIKADALAGLQLLLDAAIKADTTPGVLSLVTCTIRSLESHVGDAPSSPDPISDILWRFMRYAFRRKPRLLLAGVLHGLHSANTTESDVCKCFLREHLLRPDDDDVHLGGSKTTLAAAVLSTVETEDKHWLEEQCQQYIIDSTYSDSAYLLQGLLKEAAPAKVANVNGVNGHVARISDDFDIDKRRSVTPSLGRQSLPPRSRHSTPSSVEAGEIPTAPSAPVSSIPLGVLPVGDISPVLACIVITGLAAFQTLNDIVHVCEKYGVVKSSQMSSSRRGEAFVHFETMGAAAAAVEGLSGQQPWGDTMRPLEASLCTTNADDVSTTHVWVAGADDQEVLSLLPSSHSQTEHFKVGGKRPGIVIAFTSHASVDVALSVLNRQKSRTRSRSRERRPPSSGDAPRFGGTVSTPEDKYDTNSVSHVPPNTTLWVGGITSDRAMDQVLRLSHRFGKLVNHRHMRGCAFLEFDTLGEAINARKKLDGTKMAPGIYLKVDFKRELPVDKGGVNPKHVSREPPLRPHERSPPRHARERSPRGSPSYDRSPPRRYERSPPPPSARLERRRPLPKVSPPVSTPGAGKIPTPFSWKGQLAKTAKTTRNVVCSVGCLVEPDCSTVDETWAAQEPRKWPESLDVSSRIAMQHVVGALCSSVPPMERAVTLIVPTRAEDNGAFLSFVSYLEEKDRAGVVELPPVLPVGARVLLLLPVSQNVAHALGVPMPTVQPCLFGFVISASLLGV